MKQKRKRDTIAALRQDVQELQRQVLVLRLRIDDHEVTKFVRELLDRIDSLHVTAEIARKERERYISKLSARIAQLEAALDAEQKRLRLVAS